MERGSPRTGENQGQPAASPPDPFPPPGGRRDAEKQWDAELHVIGGGGEPDRAEDLPEGEVGFRTPLSGEHLPYDLARLVEELQRRGLAKRGVVPLPREIIAGKVGVVLLYKLEG